MTVTYDPADFNEVTVLLRWRGTIMPAVLCRPVIWLLLLAHCTFLYLHVKRQDIEMPLLDWKIVAVPTGLLLQPPGHRGLRRNSGSVSLHDAFILVLLAVQALQLDL